MDSQRFNLAEGGIARKLFLISMPIVGSQLMLMGYNLVDMFLLGRVGSHAVAASGSAGMYMWLGAGFMLIGRMGAEIGVSQSKGARNMEAAESFSHTALFLAIVLGGMYGLACLSFPDSLIGFLNIRETEVSAAASVYLAIIGLSVPASFVSASIAGTFTGAGDSRVPFMVNAAGLVLNAVLDPLFIFTLDMGVVGAAIATAIAQYTACFLSLYCLLRLQRRPFRAYRLLRRPQWGRIGQILGWTLPVAVESLLFTFFTMVVARRIAVYGADAISAYRVGSQAESLCWLICLGFSSGITAFIGQNYGAGRWTRVWRGVRVAMAVIVSWGAMVSTLFLTLGDRLAGLFVPEPKVMAMGGTYLGILAICQIFFCMESVAAGAFRGLGRTAPASIAATVCNGLRIPLVYYLSSTGLGVNGVWWGIAISATARGIWVFLWFLLYARTRPRDDVRKRESIRDTVSSDVPSVRILP